MKLIFLNRYFHPDISATSQMLSDLAFHLAKQGAVVHVITSRQRYDDPAARLPALEEARGAIVHRVWTSRFGRARLPGRVLDYLSFYLSASLALVRLARKGDIVIAKTDPPLIGVPAGIVARARGAHLVNWLQDVFPEVASRIGVRLAGGVAGAALGALRNWSLRRAATNVLLGERMATELGMLAGKNAANTMVIHNWADGEAIVPIAADENGLRAAWALQRKFVLAYSGNMGRAHEFDTILGAAERLKNRAEIVFLFIGGGHFKARIETEARARGLSNIRFKPYQPRAQLAESLGVADVHLTCLLPSMEGLIVPSKIYAILAAGRPTLHVGDPNGEIAILLEAANAGYTVPTGDVVGLAGHIEALAASAEKCTAMGSNARSIFDERFDRRIAFARWTALLDRIRTGSPARTH